MLLAFTVIILTAIAIYDLRFHRIPNHLVIFLWVIAIVMRRPSPNALLVVIFLTFGYLSWRFLKVGAGDIKLLLVVILFLLPYDQTLLFLFNFAISALVLAAIYMARFRTLRIAIPLAPAISGGYFLIIMA